MKSLDSISRDIILTLLRSTEPLSSAVIAARLRVSKRMIRYRMDLVRGWLDERGLPLEVRPNYGIGLEASQETRRQLLDEIENLSGYQLVLSSAERIPVLIFHLLTADAPLTSTVLTDDLGVSRTTLYKDLDRVCEWFFDQGVTLVRKPRQGIFLEIQEKKRRVLLESFLLDILGEMSLLNLCSAPRRAVRSALTGRVKLQQIVCDFFDSLEMEESLRLVKAMEQLLGFQFTDNAYGLLAFQVAFQDRRVSMGHSLHISEREINELNLSPVLLAVQRTFREPLETLPAELRENEAAFLAMQVLGAQRRYTVSNIMEGIASVDTDLQEIVDHIVRTAAAYLHPSLVWDVQLSQNLTFHLQTALYRLKYDLPIRNPHLEESRQKYPYIHKVARICCVLLSSQTGRIIPEEEIGKITIHLAAAMERLRSQDKVKKKVIVVCGEGISTAWLVISRLNAVFPEIEVLEILSWTQVSDRQSFPGDMDGMISTVPLEIPGIPIVQVSPLLTEMDQDNIRRVIHLQSGEDQVAALESEVSSLASVLKPEHIQVNLLAEDWREVVRKSSQLLLETRIIEENYIRAMIDVLEQHGPYMVVFPGVALLHTSPVQGVRRLGLSLVTLAKPVEFGHPDHDPVQVAIVLAAVDSFSHINALMELIDLLRDKSLMASILAASTPRDVIQAFQRSMIG